MTPLYARLPRGPHRLEPGEVAENQRQRMHGAMVEAVASHGYEAISVKQVISLAGVSRRAFYEQFSNKQECFLSTLELLASRAGKRVGVAYRSQEGDFSMRMGAALQTLTQMVADNPKSAHLALVGAPSAGTAGWTSLTKALRRFEDDLCVSFARTPGGSPLPEPVARGVFGGLHRIVFEHVCRQRTDELPGLTEEMLEWTLAFNSPAVRRLQEDLHINRLMSAEGAAAAAPASRGEQRPGPTQLRRQAPPGPSAALGDERERLLESTLELMAVEGYGNLSPLRIVDRAATSIDTFFGLFGDIEGCALAALGEISVGVRQAACAAKTASEDRWATAVRQALHSLMRYFAEHPNHARMVATGAFEMGSPGVDLSLELGSEVARTLTAGAPRRTSNTLLNSGIAGAIWHTLYCHTALQRTDRLPAVADDLTFVVLAPFLGAERAVEALVFDRSPRSFARLAERGQHMGERRGSRAAF